VALQGAATAANTILPPGMPGYSATLSTTRFDAARAKQLVAESRYPDLSRFDIVLNTPGAGGNPGRQTSAMVEMIKTALGIEIKIEQVEWATFLDESHAKKYAFFELGWIADYPDPENFLDVKFHSRSENNETQYNNPQLDSLLERARTERDTAARLRLYQQAEQLLLDAHVWIPMYHDREYTLVKKYVDGYTVPPMPIPHLRFVSVNK
jgi:ABC-type transport system substrate-binding protein